MQAQQRKQLTSRMTKFSGKMTTRQNTHSHYYSKEMHDVLRSLTRKLLPGLCSEVMVLRMYKN